MSSSVRQVDVPFVTGPQKLSYPLFRFTQTDWFVMAGLGVPAFALTQGFGFVAIAVGVVLIVYIMWPQKWGRRYTMWADAIYSWWILRILNGVLWENPFNTDDEKLAPTGWRRSIDKPIRRAHPYRYNVDRLYAESLRSELGLIHCDLGNSNTLVIEGEGSDISSLSPVRQGERIYQLEQAVRRVASLHRLSAELGIKVERRPANLIQHDAITSVEAHPSVLVPEALHIMNENPENIGKSPDKLYAEGRLTKQQLRDWRLHLVNIAAARKEIEQNGTSTRMVITVTIRRSSQLQKAAARTHQLKPEDIRRERIVQLGKSMLETVSRMGVKNPRILNKQECEDYLRESWDVAMLDQYRRLRALEADDEYSEVPSWHPQAGIYVTNDVAVFDRTNFAVIRITKMPAEMDPTFMDRLFTEMPRQDVRWLSRTLASEPVKGTREYAGLNFISAIADSLLDTFSGVRIGTKTTNRREKLAQEEESVANQGHIEYFNGYLLIASTNEVELETAVDIVLSEVEIHDIEADRVTGASRIVRAVQTAQTTIALL